MEAYHGRACCYEVVVAVVGVLQHEVDVEGDGCLELFDSLGVVPYCCLGDESSVHDVDVQEGCSSSYCLLDCLLLLIKGVVRGCEDGG